MQKKLRHYLIEAEKKTGFENEKEWRDFLKNKYGKDLLYMATQDTPIHVIAYKALNGDFFKQKGLVGYWAGKNDKRTFAQ